MEKPTQEQIPEIEYFNNDYFYSTVTKTFLYVFGVRGDGLLYMVEFTIDGFEKFTTNLSTQNRIEMHSKDLDKTLLYLGYYRYTICMDERYGDFLVAQQKEKEIKDNIIKIIKEAK